MQNVFTYEDIRKIDKLAIEHYGLSTEILMENVAANSATAINKYFSTRNLEIKNIAVFCGMGNNGGDGFALSRHLSSNYKVHVFCVGDISKLTSAAKINFNILSKSKNIEIKYILNLEDIQELVLEYDCIIDAILGISGGENLRGIISPLLHKINRTKAVKIAIDLPTGLSCDTGKKHINIFLADLVLSVMGYKIGLLVPEFNKNTSIEIIHLGTGGILEREISKNFILEKQDIKKYITERKTQSSKFDYGRVLIIAGSVKMCGAAALAANSAIKTGAGIVTLLTSKIHPAVLPEVIAEELKTTSTGTIHPDNYLYILSQIEKSDAVVIGPGVGDNTETIKLLRNIIFSIRNKPVVIDADALKCIKKEDVLASNMILTPHCGEFSQMLGVSRKEIENEPLLYINQFQKNISGACLLLKTVPTIITNGNFSYWNIMGNPGMATAGSGDVLSGIIGALAARIFTTSSNNININIIINNSNIRTSATTNNIKNNRELKYSNEFIMAAALGALIHSLVGDIYIENNSQETLTASNLIEYLKYVI